MGGLSEAIKQYFIDLIEQGKQEVEITEANAEIQKIIKDLEEQGLLLKLPCKVGNAIYKIQNNKVYELNVHSIELYSTRSYLVHFKVNNDLCCVISLDYNKTWFSTKAEAEKALAEMEK